MSRCGAAVSSGMKKEHHTLTLEFHGGAKEVTGACYRLRSDRTDILVDCGMFQGSRFCEKLNFSAFKFNPAEIDAVFITHSHIDHIGRLPKLVKEGFQGPIYSTAPTKDLGALMLEDALHFMKEPEEILYDQYDIDTLLKQWKTIEYGETLSIGDMNVLFKNSGHILGSGMVEVSVEEKKLLFTGDFGNVPSVLLPEPDEMGEGIDYLIIESTYGNRTHDVDEHRALRLERAIEDVATRGGTLMIPAFANERTQDILFELNEMITHKRVPLMPTFVDSPLAIKATRVFRAYPRYYNDDVKKVQKKDPEVFDFRGLTFTETVEESKRINDVKQPKIIVAGSGMSAGGRILHHERRYLQDARSILLVVGYQSAGSLGRALLDGAKEVTIMKETVPIRAEIRKISGYSAHADQPQLFRFVKKGRASIKKVFVVQGEDDAASQFAQIIKDQLGISAVVPTLYEKIELE